MSEFVQVSTLVGSIGSFFRVSHASQDASQVQKSGTRKAYYWDSIVQLCKSGEKIRFWMDFATSTGDVDFLAIVTGWKWVYPGSSPQKNMFQPTGETEDKT